MNIKRQLGLMVLALSATASSTSADALLSWGGSSGPFVPTPVVGMTNGVTAVSRYGGHVLAIRDGALCAWGTNQYGQLGFTGTNPQAPIVPGFATGVTSISAGTGHSAFVQDGVAYTMGDNSYGQLGNGSVGGSGATPNAVPGLNSGVTAISAFATTTMAVKDSAVYAWGGGYLGNGSVSTISTPVAVAGLTSGVTAISSSFHTIVIKDGAALAWGSNNAGQVGTPQASFPPSDVLTPMAVTELESGVTAVAAGRSHSLAIKDGNVYFWGLWSSQTSTSWLGATAMLDHAADFVDVAAGFDTSYVLSSDGNLWVWGENTQGELGLGDRIDRFPTGSLPIVPAEIVRPPEGYRFTAVEATFTARRANALIAPRTQYGDANLDGAVDFDDLLVLAQNYGTTTGATWTRGDFDLDNAVNFSDLLALAQHYGVNAPDLLSGSSPDFQHDWALALSLVPEPTALTIAASASALPLRRRR